VPCSDLQRNINFCKLRTFLRSPAFDAVKIRCRSRLTLSSAWRQSIDSQSTASSSGPFTATSSIVTAIAVVFVCVTAPNLSFGSCDFVFGSSQAHLPHVSTLSS
jgi:hypothetical protein